MNTIKIKAFAVMLTLILSVSSCATSSKIILPSFELREYRISNSLDSFEYQWTEYGKCIKKVVFWCQGHELLIKKEVINFDDKEKIKRFLDAGFILKKRELL